MKLSLESKVRQSDKVVSHQFEGTVYILDPRKNTIRVLNDSAGQIWNSIETGQTVSTAASKLVKLFKVPRKKAENDVLRYLSKFVRLKYVSVCQHLKSASPTAKPADGYTDR